MHRRSDGPCVAEYLLRALAPGCWRLHTAVCRRDKAESTTGFRRRPRDPWSRGLERRRWNLASRASTCSQLQDKQELIRRWDSERKLFYDDIAHLFQNTKKEPTSFNNLDDS